MQKEENYPSKTQLYELLDRQKDNDFWIKNLSSRIEKLEASDIDEFAAGHIARLLSHTKALELVQKETSIQLVSVLAIQRNLQERLSELEKSLK